MNRESGHDYLEAFLGLSADTLTLSMSEAYKLIDSLSMGTESHNQKEKVY